MAYLSRLSAIADNKINCGPALTWMEVQIWCQLRELIGCFLFTWIISEDEGCSLNIIHLFLQVDNKGNHLLVHEESSINVPAIAAAHVIKRYIAQAADELSFEVTGLKMKID